MHHREHAPTWSNLVLALGLCAGCSVPTSYGMRTDGLMGQPFAAEATVGGGVGAGFSPVLQPVDAPPQYLRLGLGAFVGGQVLVLSDLAIAASLAHIGNIGSRGSGNLGELELRLRVVDEATGGLNLTMLGGGGTIDFEAWGVHLGAVAALRTGPSWTVYFGAKSNPVFDLDFAMFLQLMGGTAWRPTVGEFTSLILGIELFLWTNVVAIDLGAGLVGYAGIVFGDTQKERQSRSAP